MTSSSRNSAIWAEITQNPDDVRRPLGGSYANAATILQNASGSEVARMVYHDRGLTFLSPVDHTMVGMRPERETSVFKSIEKGEATLVRLPGLVDVIPKGAITYYEQARRFMTEFNEEMYRLARF